MNDPLPSDAKAIHTIIANNEDWLIDRILFYAKRQGYTRYTSTLRAAWQQSIAGLSRPLLSILEKETIDVEFGPDENYAEDPLTRFAILEADLHRRRGVSLSMFLGLMKYYRQSYMDLIDQKAADPERRRRFALILKRAFDRIEIGLFTAWHSSDKNKIVKDLQQANLAITNEKNKYLTIFESLQSPIAVLDQNCRIVTVNRSWAALFTGASTPDADYYDDAGTGHSVAWLVEEIQPFTEGVPDEQTILKVVKTAKGQRHMAIKIKQMLDVSDKFSGCVVSLDDITQQKQAERALQETTIWLTEMFNALEEAVFVATPAGRIVDVNTAAQKIFGYSSAELKNRTTEILHVNQKSFRVFTLRVAETLVKGERAIFEYRAKRRTGDVFPAMMKIDLLKKKDGTPLGIVCILRDISALKTAEEANRESERLQGALELAGAVCHDLNQPLMAITGYAELLLMDCSKDSPHFDKLNKIVQQVTRVGAITRKLTQVTRYETKSYMDQKIIDIEKASGSS